MVKRKRTQSFPELLAYPDALRDLDECLKTLRQVLQQLHITECRSSFAVQICSFLWTFAYLDLSVFQAGAKLYQGLFQEGSRPLFHEGVPQGCIYFQIHFCNDRSVDTDDRLKGQCVCFHWPQALEAYDKGLALDKGNEECKNGKEQARPNWTEEQRSEGASTQAYQHNTKCTGSQHGNEQ